MTLESSTFVRRRRCGGLASRSPGMSRPRPSTVARSARRPPPPPLVYCDLDWQHSAAIGGHITTWADTGSLRLCPAAAVRPDGSPATQPSGGVGLTPS